MQAAADVVNPLTPDGVRQRLEALSSPEAMLAEIILRAPVGMQLCDAAGRCVLVNPMHTDLFGAVPPPGYNIFEDTVLIQSGLVDVVRRAFQGERIRIAPIWYDARQLQNVRVEQARRLAVGSELVPLRAFGEEVSHVLFVFHDVTDLHLAREQSEAAAQKALEARRAAELASERAQFLADASRVLSSSLDYEQTLRTVARLATPALADFCIVDVAGADGSLQRLAGVHADPAQQATLDELLAYVPGPGSPQPAARVMASGQAELLEVVDAATIAAHTRDQRHRDLILRLGVRSHLAVPLRQDERILGVISFGYTGERRYGSDELSLAEALASRAAAAMEQARLYAESERAKEFAERASRAKDEFLAVLGHELRNPMSPIANALEVMLRKQGPSRELEIMQRQVAHMRRLLDDLLDVSRIARGQLRIESRPMDLAAVLDEAVVLARPLAVQKGLSLEGAWAGALPVHGDAGRLLQVLTNLLTNAVRYTLSGGQVRVHARMQDDGVVVEVQDSGSGIPAAQLERIFEPFVQAHARQPSEGGLGLGLAIARTITQAHGGSLTAYSAGEGAGSTFTLRLPRAPG